MASEMRCRRVGLSEYTAIWYFISSEWSVLMTSSMRCRWRCAARRLICSPPCPWVGLGARPELGLSSYDTQIDLGHDFSRSRDTNLESSNV